jgi:hypothetical protein
VPLSFFENARGKLADLVYLEVKTLIAIKRPDLSFDDMVDNAERAISTLVDTLYRPSILFRQRHGLDQMLSNLTVQLDTSATLPEHAYALCFAGQQSTSTLLPLGRPHWLWPLASQSLYWFSRWRTVCRMRYSWTRPLILARMLIGN